MIKLVIPKEAIREILGIEPEESYTLDLSGCRTFKDVQGETVNDLVFYRGVKPPLEVVGLG